MSSFTPSYLIPLEFNLMIISDIIINKKEEFRKVIFVWVS